MAKDDLNAGFTGTPTEQPTGTATTIALTIGAVAFGLGYLMGRSAGANDDRYWR